MTESNSPQTFRIIDASLNRAAEGLRFLEDAARFLLNDAGITEQLKTMRHTIVTSGWSFQKQLVQSRDSEGDVGANHKIEPGSKDLPLAIVANSRRVQEALRTLEELAKVTGEALPVNAEQFQQVRFDLYTIEKNLIARLLRQDKAKRITGLYAIIDTQALKGRNHLEVTQQVISGGAKIIQLRDKTTEKKPLLGIAREMKNLCAQNNALFIMNDALDIALAVEADGLHIGQEDMPVQVARKLAPIDMLVGCSVFTAEQAQQAIAEGADYVAVGAVFPTPSKDTVVVGLDALQRVRQAVSVPLVAIGGITSENVVRVKKAGTDSVAVISAILGAESPENATREIINKFEG
ncbi:MAG: thiamine phosphate synthase [Dehalococcoidales bacterium]|nr:thiamine phosphate synthase [Dehalococcoidales bacterium]